MNRAEGRWGQRIDQILEHPVFRYHLQENEAAEADRSFCRHNMGHFLDVARIAWIINLEEKMDVSGEWIYAAALLHDLGKHVQYENGTPHEKVSAAIAPEILKDCGFQEAEVQAIADAINHHRDADIREERNLRGLLYRGDKASRACFACKMESECNWKEGKKNLRIVY